MSEINPSPEWTAEERKSVTLAITAEMKRVVKNQRNNRKLPEYLLDCADRIYLLHTSTANVLELNRDGILKGQVEF